VTSWGGASGRLDLLWVLWALARGGWGGCIVALHEPLRFECVCARVRVLADGLCAGWMVGAVSIEGGMGHGPWFMDCHEEGGFGGCLARSISRLCYGNCDAILKSHQYSYQEKSNFGTVSKRCMFHRAALRHEHDSKD